MALAIGVSALALSSAAPAAGSRVAAPGLRYEYTGAPGEVNHVRVTFVVTTSGGAATATVTTTDSVPISVTAPCTHHSPAATKTAVCSVELSEELPKLDLGDRNDTLTAKGTETYVLDGPGNDSISALTSTGIGVPATAPSAWTRYRCSSASRCIVSRLTSIGPSLIPTT